VEFRSVVALSEFEEGRRPRKEDEMLFPGLNHGLELSQSFHFSNAGASAEKSRWGVRAVGFRPRVGFVLPPCCNCWRWLAMSRWNDGRGLQVWYGARVANGSATDERILGFSGMCVELNASVRREE
jgi:hypothetical protein